MRKGRRTPAGVPALGCRRWGARMWGALASLRDAGALRGYTGGVVALLLNHRLIAGNPPGSGRDGGELVDVPPRPPGAGVRASGFGEGGFPARRMGCETVAGRHPQAAGMEQARSQRDRRLPNSMTGGCGSARRLIHRSGEAQAGPVCGDPGEGLGYRAIPALEDTLPVAV